MRKRLTYANVAATMALVFSMSGGALAANHYLISSTKQISPKVLKKLKVKGATGKTGSTGPVGPAGATGKEGPQGKEGSAAAYPTTLPSGRTETGDWGAGVTVPTAGDDYRAVASFSIPLSGGLDGGHTIYVSGSSATHCSGPGHADQGYLCVYQGYVDNAGSTESSNIFNPETNSGGSGTGSNGFAILLHSGGASGLTTISGTYAVTAP